MVIAYHAFPSRFGGGFIGVDVFFVLSGFLISSNIFHGLADGSFSLLQFYGRRCRRIIPALAVVLIAVTSLSFLVSSGIFFNRLCSYSAAKSSSTRTAPLWWITLRETLPSWYTCRMLRQPQA